MFHTKCGYDQIFLNDLACGHFMTNLEEKSNRIEVGSFNRLLFFFIIDIIVV
jgi:hypothetical protein